MKRSIRQRGWWSGLVAALLALGGPAMGWAATNTFPNDGNVGIGTTGPGVKLEVRGPGVSNVIGWGDTTNIGGYLGYDAASDAAWIANPTNADSARISFRVKGSSVGDTKLVILGSGNVGIGTTMPQARLQIGHLSSGTGEATNEGQLLLQANVNGPEAVGGIEFKNFAEWDGGGYKIYTNSDHDYLGFATRFGSPTWTERLVIKQATGNVGIGTTAPQARLQIGNLLSGSGEATNRGQLLLHSGVSGPEAVGGIEFKNFFDGSNGYGYKIYTNTANDYIGIATRGGSATWTERLVIKQDTGNIGIGTTAPTKKLDVAGDINVTGNINAKYQDIAEWVPTKSILPPGTVVVIDPQERNRVLPAAQPYDTRVAGVVSARPGLLLGEAGEDKAKVAHSGRITVKADAQYGPIAVGDLLVTSPTPGHAMRSTPVELAGTALHRPGTLLGKALEPLAEGQGEILVLLTLQ